MRAAYRPLDDSVAFRAMEALEDGAMRLTALSALLGVSRVSLTMALKRPLQYGYVQKYRTTREPGVSGQLPVAYRLTTAGDATGGAVVRFVQGAGVMPKISQQALDAANPFRI